MDKYEKTVYPREPTPKKPSVVNNKFLIITLMICVLVLVVYIFASMNMQSEPTNANWDIGWVQSNVNELTNLLS